MQSCSLTNGCTCSTSPHFIYSHREVTCRVSATIPAEWSYELVSNEWFFGSSEVYWDYKKQTIGVAASGTEVRCEIYVGSDSSQIWISRLYWMNMLSCLLRLLFELYLEPDDGWTWQMYFGVVMILEAPNFRSLSSHGRSTICTHAICKVGCPSATH